MRTDAQSLKVSKWLSDHLQTLEAESSVVDLHELKLPLFDVGETEAPNADKILSALDAADGVVFVSPEWNGMMSHSIMNMQHFVDKQLAHKPVMLVGVSAGRGGTYPIAQMRSAGYKNNQYFVSPEALLVQDVNGIMNSHSPEEGSPDESVQTRADYALKVLVEYAKASQGVRSSGVIDHETFANGV